MNDELIRRPDVQAMTGLSCAGIYKLMRQGRFPEPLKVTARAVRWRRSELEAWIDSKPRASGEKARAA